VADGETGYLVPHGDVSLRRLHELKTGRLIAASVECVLLLTSDELVVEDVEDCPASSACDDMDPCTLSDVCLGNGQCAGTPLTCDPMSACHTAACDMGVCVQTPVTGGTCDDMLTCTTINSLGVPQYPGDAAAPWEPVDNGSPA
jgi:hypothetical protein